MRIEDLKRWHWIVIGVVVGLVVAYVQIALGPDAASSGYEKISQQEFEAGLIAKPWQDKPILTGVRVRPAGSVDLVMMRRLVPVDRKNPDKARQYKDVVFDAPHPYSPQRADSPTSLRLNPDWFSPAWGRQNHVTLNGWKAGGGSGARDPGEAGSEITFPLREGSYHVIVAVAAGGPAAPAQLKATFNGQALPPFAAMNAPGVIAWQTTVPAGAVLSGKSQVLKLARQNTPLALREIEVVNPDFAVQDYLADVKKAHPEIGWHYGWWATPRATLALWTLGSVVLVGGIWPSLVGLLIGAGLGRPPKEPAEHDSPTLQAGAAEPAEAMGPAGPSPAEVAAAAAAVEETVEEIEAALREGMGGGAAAPAEEPEPLPAAVKAPVRQLSAAAAEPVAPALHEDSNKSYAGEFYPVVRPGGTK